jgi:hypothetical protein
MNHQSIIYLQSGTVGDFLMALYFADQVARGATLHRKPCPTVALALRRNAEFLRPLAAEYKHVRVISLARGEVFGGLRELLSFSAPRLVITWPTLGWVPLRLKLFGRVVAGLRGTLVGFDDHNKLNFWLYRKLWQFDQTIPMYASMCALAERVGYPASCEPPMLRLSVPKTTGTYILFHLFPAEASRTWPSHRWNAFLRKARDRWPDMPFIFTGAPSDRAFIQAAAAGVKNCEDKVGALSAVELVSYIDNAQLFVGVDTGTAHLAAFRKVSSVIVGTNRTPFWWATYSPNTRWLAAPCPCSPKGNCSVLGTDGVARLQCVTKISDEDVLASISEKLMIS